MTCVVAWIAGLGSLILAIQAQPRLGSTQPENDTTRAAEIRRGRTLFAKSWNPNPNGVPYNAITCLACHFQPSLGGQVQNPEFFVHFVRDESNVTGWKIYQRLMTTVRGKSIERRIPETALSRRAQVLYGIGRLEALPASVLMSNADPIDDNKDGISGRTALIDGQIGRFGWKASEPSLLEFVTSAFRNEIGIPIGGSTTNAEISRSDVSAVTSYLRALNPPSFDPSSSFLPGRRVFDKIGCSQCHIPTIADGINAYSDLLLHEIEGGEGIHIASGLAMRGEYRTTPLWGVSKTGPPYWHDGSCQSLEEAVLLHKGEGAKSRQQFVNLDDKLKEQLIEFLRRL